MKDMSCEVEALPIDVKLLDCHHKSGSSGVGFTPNKCYQSQYQMQKYFSV